ncbi:MAG: 16S rRNA (guanine(527)-N(7))-methyltransferase RsmG [Phycisphaerales bacterium]|nr:MAG: 16S rRNA (guanine(527)-N(7))-methyltransferase RsmG [Phycisphaerales bacterium]
MPTALGGCAIADRLARGAQAVQNAGMSDDAQRFDEALLAGATRWGMAITRDQLDRIRAHYLAMLEANRVMNLTRITDPVEAAVKHYLDAMAFLLWADRTHARLRTVLDVGTGAGLPAWPLAVMRPDWSVTAIDATRKKIAFLQKTIEMVGLSNLKAEHAHSQHWSDQRRFDAVLVRAVASLAKCIRQADRYVKPDGWLAAYKSETINQQEKENAEETAKELKFKPARPFRYELHLNDEVIRRSLQLYRSCLPPTDG